MFHMAGGHGIERRLKSACARRGSGLHSSGRNACQSKGIDQKGSEIRIPDKLLNIHDPDVDGVDPLQLSFLQG